MLTRAKVLDAALVLVDENGPDGLTMRGLAERLDVTATAIYHYFEGREAILEALLDGICATIVSDAPRRGDWRSQLRDLLATMVDQALAHPTASAWAITAYARRPPMLRLHEAILEILADAGFDVAAAVQVKGAVLRFCIGHIVLNEAAPGHAWRRLPKGSFPHYRATGPALDHFDASEHFIIGLGALLDGLEERIPRHRRPRQRPSTATPLTEKASSPQPT
jgi:AcrR family transcriptional regulator